MIYTTKRFSSKTWEGIKGGLKGASSGTLWGAILAPGNLTAAAVGKPKLALGLTGLGAATGAYIGGKNGYKNAVNSWKYKNDPEYKRKKDEENKYFFERDIKSSRRSNERLANDFDNKDWEKLSKELNLPPEILKYIRFYGSTWSKKVNQWYDGLKFGEDVSIPEFISFFPAPIDAKTAKYWNRNDIEEICILTASEAGDDGFVYYDFTSKLYGYDGDYIYKTFKDFLLENLNDAIKFHKDSLGPKNLQMINEFKRHF